MLGVLPDTGVVLLQRVLGITNHCILCLSKNDNTLKCKMLAIRSILKVCWNTVNQHFVERSPSVSTYTWLLCKGIHKSHFYLFSDAATREMS